MPRAQYYHYIDVSTCIRTSKLRKAWAKLYGAERACHLPWMQPGCYRCPRTDVLRLYRS